MIGYRSFRHRLWSGWHALSTRLRAPTVSMHVIAGSISGVLLLMPAGAAWPHSILADSLTSAAALDWVKGSLSLIFLLRRRLTNTNGD